VLENIESFAKRTTICNLGPESKKFSQNDLGFLYDRFYSILHERQQRAEYMQVEQEGRQKAAKNKATEVVTGIAGNAPEMGRVTLGPSPTQMDYDAFREFLAGVAKWAVTDSPTSSTEQDDKSQNGCINSIRGIAVPVGLWGTGPEPAEHEFLRRLFARWDADNAGSLSLQNVAAGFAPVKGNRDIVASIE